MTDPLPTVITTGRSIGAHITDHEALHEKFNDFKDNTPADFEAAGSVDALSASLGTAARAQVNALNAYADASAAAALAAAKAYADAKVATNTVPGAPTIGTATASAGQISETFTAPGSNGGSTITGYTATATSSDGGATGTGTGASSPIVIAGLTAGKHYTVTVHATNAVGNSVESAASSSVQIPTPSTVNRAAPFASSAWINHALTGLETYTAAPLMGFYGTSTLSSALGSSSNVCTTTGGVLNLDGDALPVASAGIIPNYYYGSRLASAVLIDNEIILVVRTQDVNPTLAYIVARGACGTSAAAHASGATVTGVRHAFPSQDVPIYYSSNGDAGAIAYDWNMPDYNVPSYHRFRTAQDITGIYGPSNMTPSSAGDKDLWVCDSATGIYMEGWQAVVTGTTVTAPGGAWATGNAITGKGGDDLTQNDGTRASNTSVAAGILTGYDLTNGRVGSSTTTSVTPASTPWDGRGWPTNIFTGYRVTSGSAVPVTTGSLESQQASVKTDIYMDVTSNSSTTLTGTGGWKKVSDNTTATAPPAGAPFWVTNTTKTIAHGVVFAAPGEIISQSTYVSPATAQLGGLGFGPYPNGTRFAIPTGVSKPTTLSFFGSMLWDALSVDAGGRGMWIMDYCGGHFPTVAFDRESVPQKSDTAGFVSQIEAYVGGKFPNYDAGPNWNGQADWDQIAPWLKQVT